MAHERAGELAARRPLVARNVAASRRASPAAAARGLAGNRGSALFRAVPIPPDVVLRVFTYCIGPTELFQGLWDLELLEQVRTFRRLSVRAHVHACAPVCRCVLV